MCITTKVAQIASRKKLVFRGLDHWTHYGIFWVNDEKFFQTLWDTPLSSVICEKSGQISPQEGPTKLSLLKGDCQDQSWMIFQLENSLFKLSFLTFK